VSNFKLHSGQMLVLTSTSIHTTTKHHRPRCRRHHTIHTHTAHTLFSLATVTIIDALFAVPPVAAHNRSSFVISSFRPHLRTMGEFDGPHPNARTCGASENIS
jgi:hypothetical protein